MTQYSPSFADPIVLVAMVDDVLNAWLKLQNELGPHVPRQVSEPRDLLKVWQKQFATLGPINAGNLDKAVETADLLASSGKNIAFAMGRAPALSGVAVEQANTLNLAATKLKEYCEAHAVTSLPTSDFERSSDNQTSADAQKGLQAALDEAQAKLEAIDRQMSAMDARLKGLGDTATQAVTRVEEIGASQSASVRDQIGRAESYAKATVEDIIEEARVRAEKFGAYEAKAEELLGKLSLASLADGYRKNANSEQTAANLFRIFSIVLMAVPIILISDILIGYSTQELTWEKAWPALAIRLAFSVVVAIPTAYMARESAKHRGHSVDLRRMALDFAALDPYLDKVSESSRDALRAEIAQRAFFVNAQPDTTSSYGIDPQQIAMKSLEIVGDVAKQRK